VRQTFGLSLRRMESTTIYEDNSALLSWKDDVEIQKIRSCKNLADLFTKVFAKEKSWTIGSQDWTLSS